MFSLVAMLVSQCLFRNAFFSKRFILATQPVGGVSSPALPSFPLFVQRLSLSWTLGSFCDPTVGHDFEIDVASDALILHPFAIFSCFSSSDRVIDHEQ